MHFQRLNDYENDCNKRLLESLATLNLSSESKQLGLFSHMVGARRAWLARLLGKDSQDIVIFPAYEFDELSKRLQESTEQFTKYISTLDQPLLESVVSYKNSKGTSFKSTVYEILVHVFNHSTYHRAQIASIQRSEGHEPIVSDYIVFARNE